MLPTLRQRVFRTDSDGFCVIKITLFFKYFDDNNYYLLFCVTTATSRSVLSCVAYDRKNRNIYLCLLLPTIPMPPLSCIFANVTDGNRLSTRKNVLRAQHKDHWKKWLAKANDKPYWPWFRLFFTYQNMARIQNVFKKFRHIFMLVRIQRNTNSHRLIVYGKWRE